MSIYELKCRVKYSEHKNLAALFNAEMREFSELSSVGRVTLRIWSRSSKPNHFFLSSH